MTSGPIHFGDTKGLICAAAKSAGTAVSRFGLSYRDVLTVAAAQQLGAWAAEGVEAKRAKTDYRRGAPTSPGLAPWAQEVIPGGAGFSRVAADDLLPPTLLGCSYPLTEDLQHDQIMDGVRILNPFLVGPDRLDAKP